MTDVDIYISDLSQTVVYTTQKEMIGKKIDDSIYDQSEWAELLTQAATSKIIKKSFEEKIGNKRYLNTVRLIQNQKKCHECHGAEQEMLGSMVVRM